MDLNRRDTTRRAQVVRTVLEEIVRGGTDIITIESLSASLHVSSDAASRIVERLVSAGLIEEVRDGVWARITP